MKKIVQFMNFDWDDNLMFMPTKIVYFSKNKNSSYPYVCLSTELFAKTRNVVGELSFSLHCKWIGNELHGSDGPEFDVILDLIDYEIIPDQDDLDHSFRGFRDCERKFFLNDLKEALKLESFGPSFQDFVYACSKKELAKNVTIITARGHSPRTIYEGLKVLKELELIKHLPLLSNIFPVSYDPVIKKFGGSISNPSEAKTIILMKILDMVQNQAETNINERYCFGFSDDDQKTYELVEKTIKGYILSGRWNKVEISLYFTGRRKNERAILSSNHG